MPRHATRKRVEPPKGAAFALDRYDLGSNAATNRSVSAEPPLTESSPHTTCKSMAINVGDTAKTRSSVTGASEPRFIPGRSGVTAGYLLPLARELQFNFEEPPEPGTSEADRYHALELLSVWEERIEAQELAAFWAYHGQAERKVKELRKEHKTQLKSALRAGAWAAHGRRMDGPGMHAAIE